MHVALFQPDIPQNAAAVLRLAACLDLAVEIIEPCGFVWTDKRLRRVGMDYVGAVRLRRHRSWAAFRAEPALRESRLILLTTAGSTPYTAFSFRTGDVLVLGRESAGVPADVHAAADARLVVPMAAGVRSLNVAMTAALVAGEALRQTGGFPPLPA